MKGLTVIFLLMIVLNAFGCSDGSETTKNYQNTKIVEEKKTAEDSVVVFDKLQSLFASLNFDTKAEDVENYATANNLNYTKQKYNGDITKYRVAFTPSIAEQRYGTNGDNVEITFNHNGTFLYADYYLISTSRTAVLYNYGTYWDFNEKTPYNYYSGYYYEPLENKNDGIIILYQNGYSKRTNFYLASDANNALLNVIRPKD